MMAQITASAISKKFKIGEIRELICSLIDRPKYRSKADLSEQLRSKLAECEYNGLLEYDDIIEFGHDMVRTRFAQREIWNFLPNRSVFKNHIHKHDSEYHDSCPICLEDPRDDDMVFKCPHCKHEICEQCMKNWLKTHVEFHVNEDNVLQGELHDSCPSCNSKLW
jgi:superfamily II helicase